MTYAAQTTDQKYAIRGALVRAEKALDQSFLTNDPGLDAGVSTLLNAASALVNAAVGSGVSTTALVASGVALVVPVTGTYVTTATPTVVGGVVTAIVLS